MVEPDSSQGASPDENLQQTGAESATAHSSALPNDEADAVGPTPTDYVPDSAQTDDSADAETDDDEADAPYIHAEPLEFIDESLADKDLKFEWYILKVQVNREDSIKASLLRRINMNGLERFFKDVVVPTEDVAEFTKTGKRRVVKKKIYPGYILVNMVFNDETWFIVRETSGIGDFTGAMGKPTPMDPKDVERILRSSKMLEEDTNQVRTAIPFKVGDRVRVKEGYFQNFEGDIDGIDQANGRVTVMINIFGRSTPVELEHWQIEAV
ncbi:NusG antitermination factor [Pirellula staleyi DSM 6068]|uniref:Transcription termination/antitermination protein NusG n=1 Tax=Pirellula staleyi (strain ATCC 27377 / DSM 6068 / ICPB 4128) TaxID=530564 RepID=D2R5P4_PIRSD|nr:transcription termination/antitermination protein NusG [Pirellula staleyi]ADB17226.1 NusG antitermination factor [Pirellula staleyi DSM 6068]